MVIRGQPRNGPPPERTLALAEIDAPRMARRPGLNQPEGTPDEPFAWEAREYLRTKIVGKSVLCTVSHTVNSGREYGSVLIGSQDPELADNVAVKLVSCCSYSSPLEYLSILQCFFGLYLVPGFIILKYKSFKMLPLAFYFWVTKQKLGES